VKRSQKQQASSQSASEVRLNQAREDVQKYKSLMQKAQSDAKVTLQLLFHITSAHACFIALGSQYNRYRASQTDDDDAMYRRTSSIRSRWR